MLCCFSNYAPIRKKTFFIITLFSKNKNIDPKIDKLVCQSNFTDSSINSIKVQGINFFLILFLSPLISLSLFYLIYAFRLFKSLINILRIQFMEMNIGGNKSAFNLYCLHHCLVQKMVKQECSLGQNMNVVQKDVQAYLDQGFFINQYAQGYFDRYSLSDLFALQRQSSICKTQQFEKDQKIIKQQIIQQCPIEKPKNLSRISLQKNILPSIRYAILNLLKKTRLLSMRNKNVNRFIRVQNIKVNRQIFSQLFSVQEFRYEVSKLMLSKKLSRQLMLSKKLSKNMANQMALFKKALKRGYF